MICVRRRNQYFTESRNDISQKEKYIKPLLTHVSNVFFFYKINNDLIGCLSGNQNNTNATESKQYNWKTGDVTLLMMIS